MWNNEKGEFVRYKSGFRDWVRRDGSTRFAPEKDRYHLYISWACPWAHRTVITRRLKQLEEIVSLSVVDPVWNENGWCFSEYPGSVLDFVNGQKDLISIYRLADSGFQGEETVPVLWDKKLKTIVNNESAEIMRMFDVEFTDLAPGAIDLYPIDRRAQIDETIARLYPSVNNGVYRAGFATSQRAYERAVRELFEALDHWENVLSRSRFLCGDRMTEADICLFTTLFRFDIVYVGHFKCNLRRIQDYPNLWGFLRDFYQTPGIAELCNVDHCKRHYYMSHPEINPTGIVPVGPVIDFSEPHSRARLNFS